MTTGSGAFFFSRKRCFFLQVSLGITDLKVLLNPLSGPQFPQLDHGGQLTLHTPGKVLNIFCGVELGMWKDPLLRAMFPKCIQ